MWFWLLVSLAGMAGLALLLLSIPLDLAFSFEREQQFRARARIGWLFGRVGKNIGGGTTQHKEAKSPRQSEPAKPEKGGSNLRLLTSLVRDGALNDFLRLARRIFSTVNVRRLNVQLHVGLDDPAETGLLWGAVAPVVAYADFLRPGAVALEPDFTGPRFAGQGSASLRIVPLRWLPPILLFALNPAVLGGLWSLWRARKK